MAIFGRGFPSRVKWVGAIASADTSIEETITNTAVATTTLTVEAEAITPTNSATGAQTILSADAESGGSSGSGSQTFSDATAESFSNSASSSQTLTNESISEAHQNSADNSQTITSAESESGGSSGSGSQATAEATAETVLGSIIVEGAPAIEESDDFNRANETLTTPWIQVGDFNAVIVDNHVYGQEGSDAIAYYDADFSDDHYAEVAPSDACFSGPAVRITPDGDCYFIDVEQNQIYSFIGSSYDILLDFSPAAAGAGDRIKLEIDGDTLSVYINEVFVDSVVDTQIPSGKPGLRAWDASTTDPFERWIDDWEGGDLADGISYGNAQGIQTIEEVVGIVEVVTHVSGTLYGEGNYGEGNYGGPGNIPTILEEIVEDDNTFEETLGNSGVGSQFINEADAEGADDDQSNNQALAETISESVINSATSTIVISDFQSEEEANSGTGSPTITESTSESVTNSGSSTQTTTDTESESEGNSGSGSQTVAEATAETLSNSAQSTQTVAEAVSESPQNSATSSQVLSDLDVDYTDNTGTGTQIIVESVSEGINNSGTNTPEFDDESPELNLTSVATSTQSLAESIVEPNIDNTGTGSHNISEAMAEATANSANSSQILSDLETDTVSNGGTGTTSTSESIAETDSNGGTNTPSMDDDVTVRIVPFSDITTGTWTVVPLYEKVDEIVSVGGYPLESIRSAVNPDNDTAVMGLQPASDPDVNSNHFVNIEFWRDGSDELNFTVNLREGSTLIATRTFLDVQETEDAPRVERIALTELEASAIVDYSNLRIELIADQV